MAVKNHALDGKIIKAAKEEFLKQGYHKASLHKIAENAGITTGALYTRYKNKDDLFCSLVGASLKGLKEETASIAEDYKNAMNSKNPQDILNVIKKEEELYLDFLFNHYEECTLLLCKSEGSSIADILSTMMNLKAQNTVSYIKSITKKDVNLDGIDVLMNETFLIFKTLLSTGCSREKAVSSIRNIEVFMEAGWKDLFSKLV